MDKVKGIFLVVFGLLIAAAVWFSVVGDGKTIIPTTSNIVIKGVVTSEKENFFKDERVKAAFAKNGYDVETNRMTSDKIVAAKNEAELNGFSDFVFPSSVPVSEKVKSTFKSSQAYNVFYSPMVVATWSPIFNILKDNSLVKKVGGYDAFDMEKYLELVQKGTRWKELNKSEEYPVNKLVLVSSSDARYSGSAKMYVSLTSYILNGNNVVSTNEEAEKVLPTLKKIVQAQGNRESSSANMTSDYVSIGRGKVPMMFTYESEFLTIAQQNKDLIKNGSIFIYPTPTVYSKHVMVVINPKAQAIVDLMKKDPELQRLAAEHGFRIEGNNGIVDYANSLNVKIQDTLVDVVDMPNYDILDLLTAKAEEK